MRPNEAKRSPKKPNETQTGQMTPFEAHCHPLKPLGTRTTKRSGFNPRWRSLEGIPNYVMKPSEPECSPNSARMQPNNNSLGPTAATQALSDRIIWKLVHRGTNNDNKLIISRPSNVQWDFPWASLIGFRIMKPNEAERSLKKPKQAK